MKHYEASVRVRGKSMNRELEEHMTELAQYLKSGADELDKAIVSDDENTLKFVVNRLRQTLDMSGKIVELHVPKSEFQMQMEAKLKADIQRAKNKGQVIDQNYLEKLLKHYKSQLDEINNGLKEDEKAGEITPYSYAPALMVQGKIDVLEMLIRNNFDELLKEIEE